MAITISGSGITSANIADGTIVNADVNDVAASKLTGAFTEVTETVTSKAAAFTPNLVTEGTVFKATFATAQAITMPTATAGKSFTIVDINHNTTWGGTIKWAGGTAPSNGTAGIDIYTFFSDGTNWYGALAGAEFA